MKSTSVITIRRRPQIHSLKEVKIKSTCGADDGAIPDLLREVTRLSEQAALASGNKGSVRCAFRVGSLVLATIGAKERASL